MLRLIAAAWLALFALPAVAQTFPILVDQDISTVVAFLNPCRLVLSVLPDLLQEPRNKEAKTTAD